MKIRINQFLEGGGVQIPPADYWVSLRPDLSEITLSAGGRDIRVKAVKRRQTGRKKTLDVQYYKGGGTQWTLVVSTPKHGEWVALLEAI
ncbi:MAG TPA: hypothetical protein VJB59_05635 [Bdellovibrionota bacterium]|nr:hypothetical protein [Bdellovibrionota bacterium]